MSVVIVALLLKRLVVVVAAAAAAAAADDDDDEIVVPAAADIACVVADRFTRSSCVCAFRMVNQRCCLPAAAVISTSCSGS
jgi:hypothetical protein